jgi:hypothetical protein
MQRLTHCRSAATRVLGGLLMLTLVVSCTDRQSPLGPQLPDSHSLAASMGERLTLRIVSGDEQSAAAGFPLAEHLVVEVVDAGGTPQPGVAVKWTVTSGDGSLRESSGQTDEAGRQVNHFTLGEEGAAQQVRVEVDGAEAVTFTVGVTPLLSLDRNERTWTGAVSAAWEDPANWAPKGVPTDDDYVIIAAHPRRSPVLGGSTSVSNIEIRKNGRLDIGDFDLVVAVDVMVKQTGAITGTTGRVVITGGDCRVMGAVPSLTITGVVQMLDATTVRGQLTVHGQLSQGGHLLQVLGE